MVELIRKGRIPNTQNKLYIIDDASEIASLEADFGNEAYCIADKVTYICGGDGVYVEKKSSGGGSSLPSVTSSDNGDVLTVVEGEWGKDRQDLIVTLTEVDDPDTFGEYICDKSAQEINTAFRSGKNVKFRWVEDLGEGVMYHYYDVIGRGDWLDDNWTGTITDGSLRYQVNVDDEDDDLTILAMGETLPLGSLTLNTGWYSYDPAQLTLVGEITYPSFVSDNFNLLWRICENGGTVSIIIDDTLNNYAFGPIFTTITSYSLIRDGSYNPVKIFGVAAYYEDPSASPSWIKVEITPPANEGDRCGCTIYGISPNS